MGTVCQYLQSDLEFDREKKTFKDNDQANDILYRFKPRKGYEEFYKTIWGDASPTPAWTPCQGAILLPRSKKYCKVS